MTVTLIELLSESIENRVSDIFTALVGNVVSYDSGTQTAQVQLSTKFPRKDRNGEIKFISFPILQDVPICFPRAGSYSLTFPISDGSGVLVVFTQLDPAKWRESGESDTVPQLVKLHSIGSGFALPMVAPRTATLIGASEPAMVIQGDEIRLGAAAAADVDAVALASKVEQDNQALFDAISNATPVPNDGGEALQTAIVASLNSAGYPNSVGSSNVKAKK